MAGTSLDLTGKWQFKEYPITARRMRDLDGDDWLDCTVPSSIFTSLIEAGRIKKVEGDSDLDINPELFGWVSEKPWVFKKTFNSPSTSPSNLLDCDRIDLVFDGLDTITSIWLNEKLIAKTNNMFIPFRFDVTSLLKQKNNTLLVKFEPAVEHAKKLMARYTQFDESAFPNPERVYIRKAQFQFGWDFCPALPGCGIFRPVRLEGVKKTRIADLAIRTVDCHTSYADIKISVTLAPALKENCLCKLTITDTDKTIEQELNFQPGEDFHSTLIRIPNPHLWWPAGYGAQSLYKLKAELLCNGNLIDHAQKNFGIRTITLNRSTPKHEANFQFEINHQPIFIKGANWLPPSIFVGSAIKDDYQKLLHAAADANINMLRVWGGGLYESEHFYNLCDQLGIMVWQDFMFACAYYPDREWFLKEVKTEAAAIIKLLRNHPSLVLWCGNNEIDWMHNTGKFGNGKKFYGKAIFHDLLGQLIAELAPDTPYIPTTPLTEKTKSKKPQQLTIHNWDVWAGHAPVSQYQCPHRDIPPFVTEFGFQALPNIETIKKFSSPNQLHLASRSIEKHNYQIDGNSRLYRYVGDLFGTAKNLEQFIYLSQITQARAAKIYVEHLRAYHKNNGVLFWQFNDCAPAITWSAIDSCKNPKALYYYVKRFFAKILVTAVVQRRKSQPGIQSISVTAINDSAQPLTAVLSCRLIDLSANILDRIDSPISIAPFNKLIPRKLPRSIMTPADPAKSCLHLLIEKDNRKIAENLFFYLPDKYIDWPQPKISKKVSKIDETKYKLVVNSNTIVKDLQIVPPVDAQLSDNFFDMIPKNEYEIIINCLRSPWDSSRRTLDDGKKVKSIESQLRMNIISSLTS